MSEKKQAEENLHFTFGQLLYAVKTRLVLLFFITATVTCVGLLYALSLPNVYKASTVLYPSDSLSSNSGGLNSQLGGLASMAGIQLSTGQDNTLMTLEILKSRTFLESFIESNNLKIPLIASEGWDIERDTLIIDDEMYDEENNKWVRKPSGYKKTIPSNWEAYNEFLSRLSVSRSQTTGLVELSFEFYSPKLAERWLMTLVNDLNEHMRARKVVEVNANIQFLQSRLEKSKIESMKSVIFSLIQEQTRKLMLTEGAKEFAFKYVQPPQVPDTKSGPKRFIILLAFFVFGIFLSLVFAITLELRSKFRKTITKDKG